MSTNPTSSSYFMCIITILFIRLRSNPVALQFVVSSELFLIQSFLGSQTQKNLSCDKVIDPLRELHPEPGLCLIYFQRYSSPGAKKSVLDAVGQKIEEPLKRTRAQTEKLELVPRQQAWLMNGWSLFEMECTSRTTNIPSISTSSNIPEPGPTYLHGCDYLYMHHDLRISTVHDCSLLDHVRFLVTVFLSYMFNSAIT